MKLLLHQLIDSKLFDLHEATCSIIEARNRGHNPGREIELPDAAIQLRPTQNSAIALATAHTRWGHVKLIEEPKQKKRTVRKKRKKKGTERK